MSERCLAGYIVFHHGEGGIRERGSSSRTWIEMTRNDMITSNLVENMASDRINCVGQRLIEMR